MARHSYGDFFEWGLQDGQIVHVDDVLNGIRCGCICPDCEKPLIAVNNPSNRKAHHFQHQSLSDCRFAYETALHYMAKDIILSTMTLAVPDVEFVLHNKANAYYQRSPEKIPEKYIRMKKLQLDSVEVEKSAGSFRPDLKCVVAGRVFYIEIAVTHFVDEGKGKKIFQDGTPLLEIDLSGVERGVHKDKLLSMLSGDISCMQWIFNRKMQERRAAAIQKSQVVQQFVNRHEQTHKVYGHSPVVYDCPLHKRLLGKIHVDEFCAYCDYFCGQFEGIHDPDIEPRYTNDMVSCVGHVATSFRVLMDRLQIK